MNRFSKCIRVVVFLSILILSHIPVYAAPVLSAKIFTSSITATLTDTGTLDKNALELAVRSTPFPTPIVKTPSPLLYPLGVTVTKDTSSGNVVWTITGLASGSQYYIRAEDTGATSTYISKALDGVSGVVSITANPLSYEKPDSDCKSIYISGKITNIPATEYTSTLQYSRSLIPLDGEALPPNAKFAPAQQGPGQTATLGITNNGLYGYQQTATPGINDNGNYGYQLYDLTQNTVYYVKEIIQRKDGLGTPLKTVDKFNSCKGYTAVGSPDETSDFNTRSYTFLAPIKSLGLETILDYDLCKEYATQGKEGYTDAKCDNQIGNFINLILKVLIAASAVLLVIQIIIKGYQYMTTDIPYVSVKAKTRIGECALGLLLALSSYVILNTINPKLVENRFGVEGLDIGVEDFEGDDLNYQTGYTYTGGTPGMAGYNFKNAAFPAGILCPGQAQGTGDIKTIAQSFVGKATYSQPRRGSPGPQSSMYLDCSSFVTTVQLCAGIKPNYNYAQTSIIFQNKEKILNNDIKVINGKGYINGKELKVGDLIGWTAQDKVAKGGHVVMYIGNGMIIDSHSGEGKNPGKSVMNPFPLDKSYYKAKFRWVNRI